MSLSDTILIDCQNKIFFKKIISVLFVAFSEINFYKKF